MKRLLLAAAIAAVATTASAQNAGDVPKPKCEPKPEYPGRPAMTVESRRKAFDRDMKAYKDCIMAYIEDRKASIKAHDAAANGAVDEYNALMKKINEEQGNPAK
jgi:hypothetical protein